MYMKSKECNTTNKNSFTIYMCMSKEIYSCNTKDKGIYDMLSNMFRGLHNDKY